MRSCLRHWSSVVLSVIGGSTTKFCHHSVQTGWREETETLCIHSTGNGISIRRKEALSV